LRRSGKLNPYISIAHSTRHHAITISCDQGRICRPLIVVRNGQPLIQPRHCEELARGLRTFDDCVNEGLIEFLDVMEEVNPMFLLLFCFVLYSFVCCLPLFL
jgi:DNA-directed RNA polymerase III subunit RPC2